MEEEKQEINGFEREIEEEEQEYLPCSHCGEALILTRIHSVSNQVDFICINCENIGFVIKGIIYESK